jgi:hypothetical protein
MPVTTHNPNIDITINLATRPVQRAGFSTVLLLVNQATNSLNGQRKVTYTNADDAATDNTAGYISAGTLAAVQTAFAQDNPPEEFKVGRVNVGGAETYSQALAAVQALDTDFYGVCTDSRDGTVIAALALTIEAASQRMLFVFEDDDASWLDAGVPAAFSTAAASYERTIGVYHDTTAEWADVAYLVDRLSFDPDETSAPWHYAPLANVDDYATDITAAQRLLAIANYINVGLPFGGEDFVMDPGKNISGRPIYEVVTADWFEARVEEDISELAVQHSARGEKIVVDATGQAKVQTVIESRLAQGVQAQHFAAGQTSVVAETITSTDRSLQRMRFTVRAQDAVAARLFNFTVYFSRDPINTPVTA